MASYRGFKCLLIFFRSVGVSISFSQCAAFFVIVILRPLSGRCAELVEVGFLPGMRRLPRMALPIYNLISGENVLQDVRSFLCITFKGSSKN